MTVVTLTVVVDDDVPSAVTEVDMVAVVGALRGVVRVAASSGTVGPPFRVGRSGDLDVREEGQ